MIARRLTLAVVVSVSAFAGVLVAGTGSAVAATTTFGESGGGAGQFNFPFGVAVNQETGDVFASDRGNWRVDRFQGSGSFSLAWGWDVNEESPAEELQTCAASCKSGKAGTGVGAYAQDGPHGIAVDNTTGPSKGDVYVADWENYRVEKFGPQGEFKLMFGGGVINGGATGTGSLTSGSTTVTSINTASRAFQQGETVTGAGIPAGTTIARVGDKGETRDTITLSQAATVSGTGVALTVAAGAGGVPNNERETVTVEGTPTGGTFTLTFTSPAPDFTKATTAPIAWDASQASVQSALEALSNIGAGNVAVSGSAGGPYTVEFKGVRYADTNVEHLEGHEEGLEPFGEVQVKVATPVEGHSEPEVCATASICQGGAPGAGDGQFKWWQEGSYIAVGPGGDVYVGDEARVQVFEESGAWKQNISLSGLSPEGVVSALAVDSSGDVFVKDSFNPVTGEGAVAGVREFQPVGGSYVESLTRFDESGLFTISTIALDPSGNVYVAETEPSFHLLKFDSAGKELASFGSKTVIESQGMAFADTLGELYVAGGSATENEESRVFVFTPPPPGPQIVPGSETGTPRPHGEATFEASVNPEGFATTYHFEYLTEKQFMQDGEAFGAGTVATAQSTLAGAEFEEEHVEGKLPEGTLVPGETYRWQLVASNECEAGKTCTAIGAGGILEETPSAGIEGPSATDVTSTSATLAAKINPFGAQTSYSLEYGTSTAYGQVFSGTVGNGTGFVAVGGYHLQELAPSTTYHYRLVTVNECIVGQPLCRQEGADHTFMTQPPGAGGISLPDGRAWEMVSPPVKGGSINFTAAGIQAADDGDGVTYLSSQTVGKTPEGNTGLGHSILSTRGADGWETADLSLPKDLPKPEERTAASSVGGSDQLFSADLASVIAQPSYNTILSPGALEGSLYLRDNANGSYVPLLTTTNVPPGTKLVSKGGAATEVVFATATPDFSHVLLSSPLSLTENAIPVPNSTQREPATGNLYEWSAGRLQLVSILPGETPVKHGPGESGVNVAGSRAEATVSTRAISDDGRWVAWTLEVPYGRGAVSKLFVRDMVAGKTVRVGGVHARYQTMSSDGLRLFFLEGGDLYELDPATGVQTDLTAQHGAGESSAGVQEDVSDVSEDGTSIYFVAKGVLTTTENQMKEKAMAGADNLYLLREAGGKWSTSYVTTLSSTDESDWGVFDKAIEVNSLDTVSSRVSPDGRYLEFMSNRSLTGYDNLDANPEAYEMTEDEEKNLVPVVDKEGNPVRAHDEEVFLYDSSTGRLVCASCKQTGARPHGVLAGVRHILVEPGTAWYKHWLAASVPSWRHSSAMGVFQPRYLSNSGRLFFDSPDEIVAQASNGLENVYEYEPAAIGSCATASATYSAHTGGCVGLISSGTSLDESAFMDASEDGNDVFFYTSSKLVGADFDTANDVYDAHECSPSVPCVTTPVAPPPCSSGDSCKPAPAPQPELFGAAPSATFSGAGNLTPTVPSVAAKTVTRALKLSRALGSCRKRYGHSKKRRAACERTAHKRYGYLARRVHNARTTKTGGK